MTFEPQAYGPVVARLLEGAACNELGPGQPNSRVRPALAALRAEDLFAPGRPANLAMARACLAGLWLRHDFLDESHALSQDIDTATGSYWHGIMHRREPDYGNAKYWFRRVGRHPVFSALAAEARTLAAAQPTIDVARSLQTETDWDPFRFVDLCQQAARDKGPLELLCRAIQQREWELLFDDTFQRAAAR